MMFSNQGSRYQVQNWRCTQVGARGLGRVAWRRWVLKGELELAREEDTQRASRQREGQRHRGKS